MESEKKKPDLWGKQATQTFIDYGRYFVPEREIQIETICRLIPPHDKPFVILELCCGEGLLAEAILERFPQAAVIGFDGSPEMLQKAQERLEIYGNRFQARHFELAEPLWRDNRFAAQAVVSSLCIHHLEADAKQDLFKDVYTMLVDGGVFVIADVIKPASDFGTELAAAAWDAAVRQRALKLDGNTNAFDFFYKEKWNMYRHFDPQDIDHPSGVLEQLKWLENAGFSAVDVHWMQAGHTMFSGIKENNNASN